MDAAKINEMIRKLKMKNKFGGPMGFGGAGGDGFEVFDRESIHKASNLRPPYDFPGCRVHLAKHAVLCPPRLPHASDRCVQYADV